MKLFNKKNLLKTPAVIVVSIVALIAGGIIVWAVTVSDTFDTADDVADTWRVEVATTTGQVTLSLRECDSDVWFCSASTTCANVLGDGDYIIVQKVDLTGQKQWKTPNTACDRPQCGIDGGQTDNLVADNTVSFTGYTARDACKTVGGRLPTKDELNCIYLNKATFGDNFQDSNCWSSTENTADSAWVQNLSTGNQNVNLKTNSYYVRCVLGW